MNKKVLLVNPPWFVLQNHISTQVPMGLCYIGAVLEKEGHEVLIWNADYKNDFRNISEGSSSVNVQKMTEQFEIYKKNLNNIGLPIWRECQKIISDFRPDYLGIATYTSGVKSSLNTAAIAKRMNPGIKVILGGPHATACPDELIRDTNVDFVVIGEGETIVKEIISESKDFSKIKSIYYKSNAGVIYKTDSRINYENIDLLPFPAKHLVKDCCSMLPISFQIIYSSRGCPYNCVFCSSHKTHGKKIRFRSPKNVVDEIEYVKKNFNTYNFFFCDDTFTADVQHAVTIVNEILKRKLNITWSCQTRPENITEKLAFKMKRSGCQRVSIGVESGSKRIRQLIKKGNTKHDIKRTFSILKKCKIDVVGFFMFGFPTETKEEIYETVNFMKKLDPVIAHCNIATPDPGTELMAMINGDQGIGLKMNKWENFFHQSPEMFNGNTIDENEKWKLVKDLQIIFDNHNKRHFRKDFYKRLFFYLKLIYKEKLYKHRSYLLAQLKGLL